MYRIVVGMFVFVTLVLVGVGSQVYAQTCPDISGTWTFQSTALQYCTAGSQLTSGPPDGTTFPIIKSGTWTFTPISADKCFFIAERLTQDSNILRQVNSTAYFAGIVHNGTKITMEMQPDNINTGGTLYAEITQYDKKTRLPAQISFVATSRIGDYAPAADPNYWTWCTISANGLIQR